MERSLTSLTYKGSIPEAILEAKRQKKLFVVYISGENEESMKLEESTWTDATLAESLSKYCVLLHIQEGSADAANFSAISIGFNGAQVSKNEGFIAADVLASTLEKAWLSLHIQETTAILSVALASQKSEPSTSSVSCPVSPAEGSSSDATVASPSMGAIVQSSERGPLIKHAENALDNKLSSESVGPAKSSDIANDQSASSAEAVKELGNGGDERSTSHIEAEKQPVCPVTTESKRYASGKDTKISTSKAEEETQNQKDGRVDNRNIDKMDSLSSIKKSSDVHLNIRLPDGVSLQEKFPVTHSLRMVKDHVDRNLANGVGSYDLAIPYPRKVFSDQDLSKSLSELGLFNRQALIVVPHQRAKAYDRGSSSVQQINSAANAYSGNGSNDGYFAYVRKTLSYMNPFSYFGGGASSSSSGPQSRSSMWEYGPNPALRNNLAQADTTSGASSSSGSSSVATNDIRNRRPRTSSFGSNIHTLRHEEDDARFGDRNTFWNGNSTQYGGDENRR